MGHFQPTNKNAFENLDLLITVIFQTHKKNEPV
jgi:hypothetical protein